MEYEDKQMKFKRETQEGALIKYNISVDKPATKAIQSIKKKDKTGNKSRKIGKILSKPKVQLVNQLSSTKAIMKGVLNRSALVSEGKTGYMTIEEEIENEKKKFLGRYSL